MVIEIHKQLDSPIEMDEMVTFMQRVNELRGKEIKARDIEMKHVQVNIRLPKIFAVAMRYYAEVVRGQTIEEMFITYAVQRIVKETKEWWDSYAEFVWIVVEVAHKIAQITIDVYTNKRETIDAKNGVFLLSSWYRAYTQTRTRQELQDELARVVQELEAIPRKEWTDEDTHKTYLVPEYDPHTIEVETLTMTILLPQFITTLFKIHAYYAQEMELEQILREFMFYVYDSQTLAEHITTTTTLNKDLKTLLQRLLSTENQEKLFYIENDFHARHCCVFLDDETRKKYDYKGGRS